MNKGGSFSSVYEDGYGLSSAKAREILSRVGPNEIFQPQKISFSGIAKHEITEPMILLLLFVGVVYSIWGGIFDALTIFVIIALLVFVEVYNEFRAKNAIAALGQLAAPTAAVIRDRVIIHIDPRELVPDDVIILNTGTKIPADAIIISSNGLQCDESALTGESVQVIKNEGDNLFAGTVIVSGEGSARVFATGKNTRLGQIARTAKDIRPPKTALQLAMKDLAGKLVYVAVFFCVLITVIGILRGGDIRTMVLTGLSLAFATIPEELPIIITMVLGIGAYQLSRHNFLIKKIKAAETLGNATVIVTDKTGTITEAKMMIAALYPENDRRIITIADLCLPEFITSPLDEAIRKRATDLGINEIKYQTEAVRDFGNGRKTRSVVRNTGQDRTIFMTGAPEEIFIRCREIPDGIDGNLHRETEKGRRVIAVASRVIGNEQDISRFDLLEKDLVFGGLIAFEDPPRPGVKETIEKARVAGIRTIMVTGDHPLTAGAIAREVGINISDRQVLTGDELDRISDKDLPRVVKETDIFARTTPEHKYRIVRALQEGGEVVAVTGDGINDTLALRGADIGIAMGIKGTDVARDAAEVVLADDNYITIARGIFEGRKFFDNLVKGIRYYLSIKTALIAIFLIPVLFGIGLPFAPIQIILLELFMDIGASAGFVSEPAENDIYVRPPRDPKHPVFDNTMIRAVATRGAFMFIAVMGVYLAAVTGGFSYEITQTCAFAAWIFGHIALAFTSRSEKDPLFSRHIFSNKIINLWAVAAILFMIAGIYIPLLNTAFQLTYIAPQLLLLIGIVVTGIILTLELRKYIKR